jgi:hypothetical protein
MSEEEAFGVRALEGRRVSLALRDGTRVDDCELVAIGRYDERTLWLYAGGSDRSVNLADIIEIWESPPTADRVIGQRG